jgi:hypothetical protein
MLDQRPHLAKELAVPDPRDPCGRQNFFLHEGADQYLKRANQRSGLPPREGTNGEQSRPAGATEQCGPAERT